MPFKKALEIIGGKLALYHSTWNESAIEIVLSLHGNPRPSIYIRKSAGLFDWHAEKMKGHPDIFIPRGAEGLKSAIRSLSDADYVGSAQTSPAADKEWIKSLFVNALTFGPEQIIYESVVEERLKDTQVKIIVAGFRLNKEDLRTINEGRQTSGLKPFSEREIQARFEELRRELSALYDIDIVDEKESVKRLEPKAKKSKRSLKDRDFSDVLRFEDSSASGKQQPVERRAKIRDLEDRLLSEAGEFWSDVTITWNEKLACLRQIVDQRGVGVGLGVTMPFLNVRQIQELLASITKEHKESELHRLAEVIVKEQERQKAQSDIKTRIQNYIEAAKSLRNEGKLKEALERVEKALSFSPEQEEAINLKAALLAELEREKEETDIKNTLKILYENQQRLKDKKITKEQKTFLADQNKEARDLLVKSSLISPELYLSCLKEYKAWGNFYSEMLRLLTDRLFESEVEKITAALKTIYTVSAEDISVLWSNKDRLKRNTVFRQALLDFMISQGQTNTAVLNNYLHAEKVYIINKILEEKEYFAVLLELMQSVYDQKDLAAKVKDEFRETALEIIKVIIDTNIKNLDYVFVLPLAKEAKIGPREDILGYLFLKINNFAMKVLNSLSAEEAAVFAESMLKGISFYDACMRQDISNAIRANLVRILESATDFVYENRSFDLPANNALFIEQLRKKNEIPQSVFSLQKEVAFYLKEDSQDKLIELLKDKDILYAEKLAILYQLAILWTGILNRTGNLKQVVDVCNQDDPLIRSYLYYGLALVRSPKYSKAIASGPMRQELTHIIVDVVKQGEIDIAVFNNLLYELKLGDEYNKLFMAYGVAASLAINRNIAVEVPGHNLRSEVLAKDSSFSFT